MAEPKNKDEARAEIKRLRDRINLLKSLVGEKGRDGVVLYYEAPGVQPGITEAQRNSNVASAERRIAELNTRWFAETSGTSTTTTTQPTTSTGVPMPTTVPSTTVPSTTAPSTSTTSTSTTAPFVPQPGQSVFGGTPITPGSGVGETGIPLDLEPKETEKKKGSGGTPAAPIDWEAIVAAIQVDALAAAKELYGGLYAIIEGDDEIKQLILDAYTGKWDRNKFQAKLRETNWWKTNTEQARKFDVREQLEGETVKEEIRRQGLQIQEMSMAKGVRLSDDVAIRLARESLRFGWDNITLSNAIGAEIVKMSGTSQVAQGFIGQQIRGTALNYGIKLSDDSFNKWTEQILTGQSSDQMFKDYLLSQAKLMYPALSDGLDRGLTFKQLTDPYAEQAARVLEIPSTQIDFTDPKFAAAFTSVGSNGSQRQMTFSEWDKYLKTTSAFGYEYTSGARNQALDLVGRIGRLFGAA